ncbi:unnamed protein product (macronuclear) [Paramecium tetraurelia]|uniref:Mei2-like C-terminal RNA recognition motif domain-containing protein n=1 Tax=Paramecium tetraurelia TaxID=5888 RepID=A0DS38_PARTE|nr:uncharacterized protein GSPATT00019559001 [Paramecium tetraurelia]CAK85855.1 unnamed protein product [Paramecium tetraurelia]|eukprot:XP_001453252.1 hypothetical protein (macronuclear) [Paramecium tetraurelia strain d4-2]
MQTSLFQEIEEFTQCSNWIEKQDSAGSSNNDLFLFGYKSKLLFSTETDSSSTEQFEAFSAIFNQAPEKCSNENENTQNQFNISLQTIVNDKRTTLMIRNIPSNYTVKRLQNEIDFKFSSKYDYLNIPCHLEGGFAFINLKNKKFLHEFFIAFNNRPWNFNKNQCCVLKYAKVQYNENQMKYQKKIGPDIYSNQKKVIDLIQNQKNELKL